MITVTRLALFDLDNILIDRDEAFRRWAEEFADGHGLGAEAVERLVALDTYGYPPRGGQPSSGASAVSRSATPVNSTAVMPSALAASTFSARSSTNRQRSSGTPARSAAIS